MLNLNKDQDLLTLCCVGENYRTEGGVATVVDTASQPATNCYESNYAAVGCRPAVPVW